MDVPSSSPSVAVISEDEESSRASEEKGDKNTVFYIGADGTEKKLEITIIKDYDEQQLEMWKRMAAEDGGHMMMDLDLPKSANGRVKTGRTKLRPSNLERGHNRPQEWLNPNLKIPEKMTYFVKKETAGENLTQRV